MEGAVDVYFISVIMYKEKRLEQISMVKRKVHKMEFEHFACLDEGPRSKVHPRFCKYIVGLTSKVRSHAYAQNSGKKATKFPALRLVINSEINY